MIYHVKLYTEGSSDGEVTQLRASALVFAADSPDAHFKAREHWANFIKAAGSVVLVVDHINVGIIIP